MQLELKFRALAGLGAGWVMWLLVSLSVLVVAVSLERGWLLFRTRERIDELQRNLRSALGRGDVAAAHRLVLASPSPEARVVAAGLAVYAMGSHAVEERLASEAQMVKLSLEKHLGVLGTIGANAPFLGLLGTVIGIVRAFRALDASGGQISTALMAEIGEALTATAVGLFVALPAVVLFNVLQRQIGTRIALAEALGRDVLSYVKSGSAPRKGS